MIRPLLPVALIGLAIATASAQAQTLYGISNGFNTPENNRVYKIDPANGDLTDIVQVTMPKFTVFRSFSMVAHPVTGVLWAAVGTNPSGMAGRHLVTINPATGVAADVGLLPDGIASLTFRPDGTLYGVTGDGAGTNPETLFRISTADASAVLLFPLGNGADGETIAFHPNGLIYHSSGNSTALFESVDPDTRVITPIGQASGESFAMGYNAADGQMYLSDINSRLFTVDIATGARTLVGEMSDQLGGSDNRAVAFVPAGNSCEADFNTDGVVNSQDFFDFLTAFFTGCP